jgi:hypothetical protein
VLDLFSRRSVGWPMDKNIDLHLVIRALVTALWKRQPKETVLVHSDHGSQYGRADYLSFLKENILKPSMSRRGNCHANAGKCLANPGKSNCRQPVLREHPLRFGEIEIGVKFPFPFPLD